MMKQTLTYAQSLRLESAHVFMAWPAAACRDARNGGFAKR
jgi:hypothetical protein